MTAVA